MTGATWSPDGRWVGIEWGPGYSSSVYGNRGQWWWIWDVDRMRLSKVPRRVKEPLGWSEVGLRFLPGGQYLYVKPNFIRLGRRLAIVDAELPRSAEGMLGWSEDESRFYFQQRAKPTGRMEVWSADLPSGSSISGRWSRPNSSSRLHISAMRSVFSKASEISP